MVGPTTHWGRILALALVVLLAGLIAGSDVLHEKTEALLAAAEQAIQQYPRLGPVLFVLLAMASAMLFFFSSAVLVPLGIQVWGLPASVALLWLGWLLGGMLTFAVGRGLGRPAALGIIGEARMRAVENRLQGRVRFGHIVLLQLSLPSEIPGYVLGALGYAFWPYVGALALAELPYALGTAMLGVSFLQRQAWVLIALGLAGLAVVAGRYFVQRQRRARARDSH